VNFFGHAILAARQCEDEAFVWGAMVPDFVALTGVRPEVLDPAVAAGVAHHHRVDVAFHAASSFCRLLVDGVRSLREAAVPRGGARGAAHVGVELFVDGTLLDDLPGRRAFARALELGRPERLAAALRFANAADADRWWRVQRRLREHARPEAYADPQLVCERVAGALAHRPRLALDAPAVAALRRALPALRPRVVEAAPALLSIVAALV
jgi:hypothetical protein